MLGCFKVVEDEDRHWNEKPEDEDEYEVSPYTFVPNKQRLAENNGDITLPSTVSECVYFNIIFVY